jgi:peptidoglycan/LPS O-acetylase OafA/YrhL
MRGGEKIPVQEPQFRPDIEGLRALAVGLVVAFHGFGQPFTGGFVGVDVFFVISGFLITSLLLRENAETGRISISGFYARRVRRILPASALVVISTIVASYLLLGFATGNLVAAAAKWTAVFAANVHFGIIGTDYFGAASQPSPLLHMWSLGVEEQFYIVWPGLFLLLVVLVRRHRSALAATLIAVGGASFLWSIIQTSTQPTWAYFSPFTRAWELGLGALVAVLAPTIARLRQQWLLEAMSLVGLVGIIASGVLLNQGYLYPSSTAAWPVVSTALVIAAGCSSENTMTACLLSVRPMQWIGARSYSLYLWHWPILIITAQYEVTPLALWQESVLVAAGVIASAVTYQLLENPVRRAPLLVKRTGLSLTVGAVLIVGTIAIAQGFIATHGGSWNPLESVQTTPSLDY